MIAKRRKRIVLKNKKRFTCFIILVVLCVATFVMAMNTYGYRPTEFKTVTVKPGDTLWDIARDHSSGVEIRKFIYQIKKLNNLEDSTIYAGTLLKLPVIKD